MKSEAVQDSNIAMHEEKKAHEQPSLKAGRIASPAESVAPSSPLNREAAVQENPETAQRTEPLDYKKLYEESQLEIEELQLKRKELQLETRALNLKKKERQLENEEMRLETRALQLETRALQLKKKEWQLENEERSLGPLRTRYRKLVDRTNSAPHLPVNHGSPTVAETKLELDTLIDDWIADEKFWMAPLWAAPPAEEDKFISCDSEGGAQSYVIALLEAVLRALKLDRVVEVAMDRTLAGVECDLLLAYKPNRLPFSPVNVKKPGRTLEEMRKVFCGWPKAEVSDEKEISDGEDVDEEDEEGKASDGDAPKGMDEVDEGNDHKDLFNGVAGETLNECGAVKLFGLNYVVGLIATGNHWRITSSRPIETNTILDRVDRLRQNPNSTKSTSPGPPQQGVKFRFEKTNEETEDGTLFASQIVPGLEDDVERAGEAIVKLAVAYVLMACASLVELLDREEPLHTIVVRPKMSARILEKSSPMTFAFGTVRTPSNLNLSTFIPDNLTTLHVIHHLGLGGNGNCCLAISRDGSSSCAIKFFHRVKGASTAELAKRELRHWKIVYGATEELNKCCTWGNKASACLVMPYLKPIFGIQERRKLLDDGDMEGALRGFASSGYVHCDIKWRHFGQLGEKLYLSDLGNIKKANEEGINSWVENSLNCLREDLLKEEKQQNAPLAELSGSKRKLSNSDAQCSD